MSIIRRAIAAVAAVTVLGAMAGCANSSQPQSGSVSSSTSASLRFALWDPSQESTAKDLVAQFNKQYPNIKVTTELTPYAQYWSKLQTEGSSATLPDVFWVNMPNFPVFEKNGLLAQLNGTVNPADFPAVLSSFYTRGGNLYAVPKDYDDIQVWINKSMFSQAGVAIPNNDWNWDQFNSVATALSSKLKATGDFGVVADYVTGGHESYYNTILQAGGQIVTNDGKQYAFNTPEASTGLQFWRNLISSGVSPTVQQLSDTAPEQWFISGKAAMMWGGPWHLNPIKASAIANDVTVVNMPTGMKSGTELHGIGYAVAAKSKHLAAAKAFAKFLGSFAAQESAAKTSGTISAHSGTQAAFVASAPSSDNLQAFVDGAKYATAYPSTLSPNWESLDAKYILPALNGSVPVKTALEDMQKAATDALAGQ